MSAVFKFFFAKPILYQTLPTTGTMPRITARRTTIEHSRLAFALATALAVGSASVAASGCSSSSPSVTQSSSSSNQADAADVVRASAGDAGAGSKDASGGASTDAIDRASDTNESLDAFAHPEAVSLDGNQDQPGAPELSAGPVDANLPSRSDSALYDGSAIDVPSALDGGSAGQPSQSSPDSSPDSTDGDGLGMVDGGAAAASLVLSDFSIDVNPKMVLGCYVSWTTAEPANSEVQFGEDDLRFHVVDDTLTTKHKMYVLGMHAQTSYRIKALSRNTTATGSVQGSFGTGTLPGGFRPHGTVLASVPDKMQRGWTLANLEVDATGGASPYPPLIVIVDEAAQPVWYYVDGTAVDTTGDVSTTWLASERHILIGPATGAAPAEVDLEGNVIWTGPAQSGTPKMGHHAGKLSNGNHILLREGNGDALVQEVDANDNVVWSWDLYTHNGTPAITGDWCHPNSVTIDETGDFLYLNCRFQGLFKANRHGGGDILWQMGAGIDSMTTGDVAYLPTNDVRIIDTHDPELHDDGTILFYDNQGYAGRTQGEKNGSYHSRVVEYQVDQVNKTATLAWEFPGSFAVDSWYTHDWYTPAWGDADRQPNGNVLITAGNRGVGTQTRIFEVTRAGEIVWAMAWPDNTLSYRADRISPPLAADLP